MNRPIVLALALSAALSGCVHTVEVKTVEQELPQALVSVPQAAWRIEEAGKPVGFLLRFDPSMGDHESFHSVRNVWNQELGLVDAEGRSWRYQPHQREPLWLGTGTVERGTYAILGLDEEQAQLVPIGLDELRSR